MDEPLWLLSEYNDIRLVVFWQLDDWNSRQAWRCTCKTLLATYHRARNLPLDFYHGIPLRLDSELTIAEKDMLHIGGEDVMHLIGYPSCRYGPMFSMVANTGEENNEPYGFPVPGKNGRYRQIKLPVLYRVFYGNEKLEEEEGEARTINEDNYPWIEIEFDDNGELDLSFFVIHLTDNCILTTLYSKREGNLIRVDRRYGNSSPQKMFTLDMSSIKSLDQLFDAVLDGASKARDAIQVTVVCNTLDIGLLYARDARTRGSFDRYVAYLDIKYIHKRLFGLK
jgi:hypothetical protein